MLPQIGIFLIFLFSGVFLSVPADTPHDRRAGELAIIMLQTSSVSPFRTSFATQNHQCAKGTVVCAVAPGSRTPVGGVQTAGNCADGRSRTGSLQENQPRESILYTKLTPKLVPKRGKPLNPAPPPSVGPFGDLQIDVF